MNYLGAGREQTLAVLRLFLCLSIRHRGTGEKSQGEPLPGVWKDGCEQYRHVDHGPRRDRGFFSHEAGDHIIE